METKFVEKMLKKELIKQGQELEKEMLVRQERIKALEARNKSLYDDFVLERDTSVALIEKTEAQAKEITDLNIKVKTLEGKVVDMTNDWATDNQSAEKQIEILKAELTSANKICGNKANLIETLKEENSVLNKGIVKRNIINFILGVCVIVLFGYICITI